MKTTEEDGGGSSSNSTNLHELFCDMEECVEAWEYQVLIDHGSHQCVNFLCHRHMLEMTKYQPETRPK